MEEWKPIKKKKEQMLNCLWGFWGTQLAIIYNYCQYIQLLSNFVFVTLKKTYFSNVVNCTRCQVISIINLIEEDYLFIKEMSTFCLENHHVKSFPTRTTASASDFG